MEIKDISPTGEIRKNAVEIIAKLQRKISTSPPEREFLRVSIKGVAAGGRWRESTGRVDRNRAAGRVNDEMSPPAPGSLGRSLNAEAASARMNRRHT